MARHRGSESRAFFNVLSDLQKDLLKILVVLLLREDLQTLDQRQTGVDHHRKLAREHRQVFRLYFLASTDLRNADLAALLFDGRKRNLLAPQNLTKRFAVIGDAFADHDFVQSVAAFEDVRWHNYQLR